jgi:hypothetical protein
MSAKGHAAVATALVPKLNELPPRAKPRAGLPKGRSLAPTSIEWALVIENDVTHSTQAACETKEVREWLRVSCHKTDGLMPTGVFVEKGGLVDTSALASGTSAVLLTPLVAGEEPLVARFQWRDHSRWLTASMGADGKIDAGFSDRQPKIDVTDEQREERRVASTLCGSFDDGKNCDLMNGFIKEPTVDTWPSAISLVYPTSAAVCGDDEARAGAFPVCAKLCDALRPCTKGTCTPWMGASVCRGK